MFELVNQAFHVVHKIRSETIRHRCAIVEIESYYVNYSCHKQKQDPDNLSTSGTRPGGYCFLTWNGALLDNVEYGLFVLTTIAQQTDINHCSRTPAVVPPPVRPTPASPSV